MATINTTNKSRTPWNHPEETALTNTVVKAKQALVPSVINNLYALYYLLYSQKLQIEAIRSNPHQWSSPTYYMRAVSESYPGVSEEPFTADSLTKLINNINSVFGVSISTKDIELDKPINPDGIAKVLEALKRALAVVKNYRSWWKSDGYCARSCQVACQETCQSVCQSTCQLRCQGCNNWQCHDQKCGTF